MLLSCVALAACGGDPIPSIQPAVSPVAIANATPTPTSVPTASPSRTPTATPVPTPRPFVPTDWGRVAIPAFADRYGSTGMLAVAASGGTVVAVGRAPGHAAAWRAGPGGDWRRVADIPSFANGEMDDVVATMSGFVAVGAHAGHPAAWTSTDGIAWVPAVVESPPVDPNGEGGSVMQHVTAGSNGLAAIGTGRDSSTGPAVWVSSDGLRWTISVDPLPGISVANDMGLNTGDIGVLPDGQFMIVGLPNAEDGPSITAWRSTDARTWKPVAAITETWLRGFTTWRDGVVAVGSAANGDTDLEIPALWTMTPDGVWSRVEDVPGAGMNDRDVSLVAITATTDRLIATGPSPSGGIGIWMSTDGRSWSRSKSPGLEWPSGEFEPTDVVAGGDGLVVVGDFPNGDPSHTWSASVWTDPAPVQPAGPVPAPAVHPCPAGVVALVDVAEMSPAERLTCFARDSLTLRGYLGQFSDSGTTAFPATPSWLADATSCCRPFMPLLGRSQDIVWLPVAFDPAAPSQSTFKDGAAIQVIGHFDDPRATACREQGVKAARSVAACRQQFVVMSVTRIDQP